MVCGCSYFQMLCMLSRDFVYLKTAFVSQQKEHFLLIQWLAMIYLENIKREILPTDCMKCLPRDLVFELFRGFLLKRRQNHMESTWFVLKLLMPQLDTQ